MTGRPRPTRYVADVMTVGNGLCGFLAVAVVAGLLDPGGLSIPYAVAALVGLGTVLDAMDGVAARAWGSTGRGGTLDLMSDATTFVVAPALLVVRTQGDALHGLTLALATALVFAGFWRLARNLGANDDVHFQGVPVSWSGPTLTIAALVVTETDPGAWVLPSLLLLLAALNVSRIPYPKTHGRSLTRVVAVLSVLGVLVVGALVLAPAYRVPVLLFASALAFVVVFLSPVIAPLLARGPSQPPGPGP